MIGFLIAGLLTFQLGQLDATPEKQHQYIQYAAEQQTVPAGKRATLELHFHVLPGFHVNSHTPKSELLIPTQVALEAADGVRFMPLEYPAGQPYSFAFDPTEKLDVYAGDFTVRLPVTATPGDHELKGTLRYQACNSAACYPPRTLPVSVLFTAR